MDNDQKKKIVELHVSEKVRMWVYELMKVSTAWTNLKDIMIKEQGESVTEYTNRFKICVKILKNTDFDKAKNLALKIEASSKDNKYDTKKAAKILVEESKEGNSFDIDSLIAVIKSLKICRVKKRTNEDIQEIKDAMKQLIKVLVDLVIKNSSQQKK
ncbi:31187_t:CDS:2 [Racocetra persica]|uniref:31187_t:CDS:1 n=1 Tax=Racocetra persica TaxID=160502 RepID=A0ACA9P5B3_9GLOM|nr:31187_t:CDS:2 [Racocetra persica]